MTAVHLEPSNPITTKPQLCRNSGRRQLETSARIQLQRRKTTWVESVEMSIKYEQIQKSNPEFIRDFERGVLRSKLMSVFTAVIAERRKSGFTLKELSRRLNVNKSMVSRWFSGDPNWRINTISDIANALDIDIEVTARDRQTGRQYGPAGVIGYSQSTLESPITTVTLNNARKTYKQTNIIAKKVCAYD